MSPKPASAIAVTLKLGEMQILNTNGKSMSWSRFSSIKVLPMIMIEYWWQLRLYLSWWLQLDISVLKPSKRWVEEVVEDNEKLEKEGNEAADVDHQPKISWLYQRHIAPRKLMLEWMRMQCAAIALLTCIITYWHLCKGKPSLTAYIYFLMNEFGRLMYGVTVQILTLTANPMPFQ